MTAVPARETCAVSRTAPRPGLYRHFKGGEYELLELARHSETEELLVVYRSLADPATTWVRPADMFSGVVERADGCFPRFELIAPTRRRSEGPLTRLMLRLLRLPGAGEVRISSSAPRPRAHRSGRVRPALHTRPRAFRSTSGHIG